jgi:hypothetical protein
MTTRTILEIVKSFCSETGLSEPTSVIGSTDDQNKQILALANREGKEFAGLACPFGGWQSLHTEYTFTTVNGQASYSLPSDLEYFAYETFWDGARRWELVGPIDAQEKQLLRYGNIASGPRRKFYIRADKIYLDPVPTVDGETIAFDYYSNAWVLAEDGVTTKSRFSVDTDTLKIDEDCFIMGLKWRFLRAKGLDYAQEQADYTEAVNLRIARDCGQRSLSMSSRGMGNRFIDESNLPDSGLG